MKQRSLIAVFVLNLVTVGIYQLYWLITTRREMIQRGAPAFPSLAAPLFAWLFTALLAASAFIVYNYGQSDVPVALVVLLSVAAVCMGIIAIIVSIQWFYKYAEAVEYTTGKHLSHKFVFWMGILFCVYGADTLWMLVMQYHYNRVHLLAKPKKTAKK